MSDNYYKSIGIRLEGTPEQIDEALRRLKYIFCFYEPKFFDSQKFEGVKLVYLRAYVYERVTLPDLLHSAESQISQLEYDNYQLHQRVDELLDELGRLPKPQPTDAVLGSPHQYPRS